MQAARAQTLSVETTVFTNVVTAFINVVRDQNLLEVARNNEQVLRRQSTLESCDRLLILRRGERVSWEWDVRQASGEVVSAPGA